MPKPFHFTGTGWLIILIGQYSGAFGLVFKTDENFEGSKYICQDLDL